MVGPGQEWLAQDKEWLAKDKMAQDKEWLAKDKMAQNKNSWPRTRIKLAQEKDEPYPGQGPA